MHDNNDDAQGSYKQTPNKRHYQKVKIDSCRMGSGTKSKGFVPPDWIEEANMRARDIYNQHAMSMDEREKEFSSLPSSKLVTDDNLRDLIHEVLEDPRGIAPVVLLERLIETTEPLASASVVTSCRVSSLVRAEQSNENALIQSAMVMVEGLKNPTKSQCQAPEEQTQMRKEIKANLAVTLLWAILKIYLTHSDKRYTSVPDIALRKLLENELLELLDRQTYYHALREARTYTNKWVSIRLENIYKEGLFHQLLEVLNPIVNATNMQSNEYLPSIHHGHDLAWLCWITSEPQLKHPEALAMFVGGTLSLLTKVPEMGYRAIIENLPATLHDPIKDFMYEPKKP